MQKGDGVQGAGGTMKIILAHVGEGNSVVIDSTGSGLVSKPR
jgi:hypothetical protein